MERLGSLSVLQKQTANNKNIIPKCLNGPRNPAEPYFTFVVAKNENFCVWKSISINPCHEMKNKQCAVAANGEGGRGGEGVEK